MGGDFRVPTLVYYGWSKLWTSYLVCSNSTDGLFRPRLVEKSTGRVEKSFVSAFDHLNRIVKTVFRSHCRVEQLCFISQSPLARD